MGFDSSEYGVCHSDELYLFWNPYWFGNYSLNKVTWGTGVRTKSTVGVIKICSLVFRELLSLGCTYVQNLCGHLQEEVLRFPKHPQLVKFG